MADTITDSMRALLLEIQEYQTNVFEFIGDEHTSQNIMITAVKQPGRVQHNPNELRERLRHLASLHGITQQRLARWTNVPLQEPETCPTSSHTPARVISHRSMPPI
mmetsp:Transcript_20928/g.48351  ORF Transcript_20928/g.48351 Transcript_20928/m.48351 type:complete len:106 (-) Transcript_20928:794-1111(-)